MATERIRIIVEGRVQGVFFRASALDKARQFNLKGWARNLSDSNVEIVAEGEKKGLEQMKEWASHGPSGARVTGIKAHYEPATHEFESFTIR